MRKVIPVIVVASVAIVASGFSASMAPGERRTTPLRVSDLTLDRAFRITVPMSSTATTLPTTATQGMVITHITCFAGLNTGSGGIEFSINGSWPELVIGQLLGGVGGGVWKPSDVGNPPIVVRPGDTLTIRQTLNPGSVIDVTVGGYFVYPGEV